MELKPVRIAQRAPAYPTRRWRHPHWMRRVANVVTLSLALTLGAAACGGGENRDEPDVPGAMPAPTFWCADERPEYVEPLLVPGESWGELCGESQGWASLVVTTQRTYRISLFGGAEWVDIALLDPSNQQVAQLDADMLELLIELTPGTWTLVATAVDPVEHGAGAFSLFVGPSDAP